LNIFFSNILLYLVNIHLLIISEICYSQFLEHLSAYFYPHVNLHYYLYSAVLHNQEHLYPHSSISHYLIDLNYRSRLNSSCCLYHFQLFYYSLFVRLANSKAGIKPTAPLSAFDKENSIEFSLDSVHYLYKQSNPNLVLLSRASL